MMIIIILISHQIIMNGLNHLNFSHYFVKTIGIRHEIIFLIIKQMLEKNAKMDDIINAEN